MAITQKLGLDIMLAPMMQLFFVHLMKVGI